MRLRRFRSAARVLFVLAIVCAAGNAGAQDMTGSRLPPGKVLERSRVGSFPRRPFEWGRTAEFHRRPARDSCGICVSNDVTYSDVRPRLAATARSMGTMPVETVVQQPIGPGGALTDVRRKFFQMQPRSITAATLTLTQIGVVIDQQGRIHASGAISSAGGPTGAWRGEQARIRLRVYTSAPGDAANSSTSLLWSTSVDAWVSAGETRVVSLAPDRHESETIEPLRRGFFEITAVEVVLETPDMARGIGR